MENARDVINAANEWKKNFAEETAGMNTDELSVRMIADITDDPNILLEYEGVFTKCTARELEIIDNEGWDLREYRRFENADDKIVRDAAWILLSRRFVEETVDIYDPRMGYPLDDDGNYPEPENVYGTPSYYGVM